MTVKALLIDLSGTLHIGKEATAGAVQAFSKLQQSNIPFRLASNTTKESKAALLERLDEIGFKNVKPEHLITSLSAASTLVREQQLNPLLLLSESAKKDFPTPPNDRYDSVVVGLAPERLSYQYLNQAFRILQRANSSLIATHKATYFKSDDGELSLGPGPFVEALEQAAEVKAQVVGKPTRSFYERCLGDLERDGISPTDWSSVAVIGDDIKNDLGGAAIESVTSPFTGPGHVLTSGKYRPGDENKAEPGQEVSSVENSFASVIDRILST